MENVLLLLCCLTFHNLIPVYTNVCSIGFYGTDCSSPCRFPSYGFQCQLACNCTADTCNHVSGCIFQTVFSESSESTVIDNRTSESSVNKTNNSTSNVERSSEKYIIAYTFAGIAVLLMVLFTVFIYHRKKSNVTESEIDCEEYEEMQSQNTHSSYTYPTNKSNQVNKRKEYEVKSETYDTIPEEIITHREQDPVQHQENISVPTNQEDAPELPFRTEDDYVFVAQIDDISDCNKELLADESDTFKEENGNKVNEDDIQSPSQECFMSTSDTFTAIEIGMESNIEVLLPETGQN